MEFEDTLRIFDAFKLQEAKLKVINNPLILITKEGGCRWVSLYATLIQLQFLNNLYKFIVSENNLIV